MNMVRREDIKISNSRSKSATGLRNVTTSIRPQPPTENGKQSGPIRSVGPVTRSLARAFLTQTGSKAAPSSSLCKKTVAISIPAKNTVNLIARGTAVRPTLNTTKVTTPVRYTADDARLPPAPPPKTGSNLLSRQSRPFSTLNKIAARLTPLKTKAKQKNVTTSKDSVLSDETDIHWVAGHDYEFSENPASIFPVTERDNKRDLSCSYLRVSQVLNGYGRRSKTPDTNELNRVYKEISHNSANNNRNRVACQSAKSSPIPGQTIVPSGVAQSQSSSEVSDNGFCEGRNELEECSSYSFVVPHFSEPVTDGVGYHKLMDLILTTFNSHLKKCDTLLENQTSLPDLVAESVRVAVGRTQLLMRKRLTQFNQQLERHLNPISGEKETTLNDLHGLWSLVDIQINDIRTCFDDVEASRLSDWQAPAEQKPALITASSMPSLRVITTGKENKASPKAAAIHKSSADETAMKEKEILTHEKSAAAAKKRQDEIRRRQEFIRAKRAEMATATTAAAQSNGGTKANGATTSMMMVVP